VKNFFALLITALFSISASASADDGHLRNIHYGSSPSQVFDLWLPKSKSPTPLVIYIHGGGFTQGSKDDFGDKRIILKYLSAGIAFASINYRFLNEVPLQTILHEDIAGFVQFIRFHARDYNLEKRLIFSFGYSAGGSASLWLGTHADLANPRSADPLKRESTRIQGVGHLNAQVSYDMFSWFKFFKSQDVNQFVGEELWTRYHLHSMGDLFSPNGIAIRSDLDFYQNMSRDDAPVLFANNYKANGKLDVMYRLYRFFTKTMERSGLYFHENTP
jgi:hypothetical protein